MSTTQDLDRLVSEASAAFEAAGTPADLEQVKARYLGKAGVITELLKGLGRLPAEERRSAGGRINEVKQAVEEALANRRDALKLREVEARLAQDALDVTLPGRSSGRGSIHPIIRTWQRIEAIFGSIGFDVADGPEIETD